MPHPEMELKPKAKQELKTGMKALYSSTEKLGNSGITNKVMTGMIQQLFLELKGEFSETLPEYLIQKEALLTKDKALLNIHFPKTTDLLARAQFRLKFEELFYIQLQLILKNLIHKSKIKGQLFDTVGHHFNAFYKSHLPFELTNAQKRVLKEIRADMGTGAQMNRLLQGDVGSGKTIVGFMSMLNGYRQWISSLF